MEIIDNDKKDQQSSPERPEKRRFIISGLVLLGIGCMLIAKQMGILFADWVFSWQMLLICIGVYIGEKHRFRNPSFLVPILIGTVFLIRDYYPDFIVRQYVWPAVLIVAGLILILRPRRVRHFGGRHRDRYNRRLQEQQYNKQYYNDTNNPAPGSGEDYIDNISFFGSIKKNILTKDFKGGEATSFFGGTELNLMQADIHGSIVLEVTQIFGGCKLIIPPHWEVKSEIVNIFGGMEDKRPIQNITVDPNKVLLLKGTSIFGGIEIRSY